MQNIYKIARNKAWEVLVNSNINSLPVSVTHVAKTYDIKIIKKSNLNCDGFSMNINNQKIVVYNNNSSIEKIRFIIAHELGHCILKHILNNEITQLYVNETDDYLSVQEIQANIFARGLLMPATVLHSINVQSVEEIVNLCNVTKTSAMIKYERLLELNKKNLYNEHYLEKQIHTNFTDFIEKFKKT